MNRREILTWAGLSTMAVSLPFAFRGRKARAEGAKYEGPYLIALSAGGGWDPTLFCDAKKTTSVEQNLFQAPSKVGAVSVAPIDLVHNGTKLFGVPQFFQTYGSKFLVVNGLDTQTNNHDTGVKHVWSGKAFEELPSIGALLAAQAATKAALPLPYVSLGGYAATAGIVPMTPISSPNPLRAGSLPNVINPGAAKTAWDDFHVPGVHLALKTAKAQRLSRLEATLTTPTDVRARHALNRARLDAAGFAAFAQALPDTPIRSQDVIEGYTNGLLTHYLQGVEIALAAFQSGQGVAANLEVFGFDTHAAHDANHPVVLGHLAVAIDFIFKRAAALGIADKLYLVVGSDFGRTPTYNEGQGKDHWNVTSMLLSGPGIRGGRVVGGTDDELRPLPVSSSDPTQVLGYDDPAGSRLYPAHIQRALRKALGIASTEVDTRFGLPLDVPFDDLLS